MGENVHKTFVISLNRVDTRDASATPQILATLSFRLSDWLGDVEQLESITSQIVIHLQNVSSVFATFEFGVVIKGNYLSFVRSFVSLSMNATGRTNLLKPNI